MRLHWLAEKGCSSLRDERKGWSRLTPSAGRGATDAHCREFSLHLHLSPSPSHPMFDWLRRTIMCRSGGRCPSCGSKRVTVIVSKRPRFVVDGPMFFEYRCRSCGHEWRLLARAGL